MVDSFAWEVVVAGETPSFPSLNCLKGHYLKGRTYIHYGPHAFRILWCPGCVALYGQFLKKVGDEWAALDSCELSNALTGILWTISLKAGFGLNRDSLFGELSRAFHKEMVRQLRLLDYILRSE